jgi:hypothetical protein
LSFGGGKKERPFDKLRAGGVGEKLLLCFLRHYFAARAITIRLAIKIFAKNQF